MIVREECRVRECPEQLEHVAPYSHRWLVECRLGILHSQYSQDLLVGWDDSANRGSLRQGS